MSYFQIDRTPPCVKRPDATAIAAAVIPGSRRERSLRTCHRPKHAATPPAYRGDSDAFVPQCSARILNDPALTDGARRCAAKLMELVYRRSRKERCFEGTVSYLAKALGRSERAVQTYLAQLRAGGYIRHEVIRSERARMCVGVLITLLEPLFPKHHRGRWPTHTKGPTISGVKPDSDNYSGKTSRRRFQARMGVEEWAWRCMDGVLRAFMQSDLTAWPAHQTGLALQR